MRLAQKSPQVCLRFIQKKQHCHGTSVSTPRIPARSRSPVLRASATASGESFARPFFAVAHGHFRFSPNVVVAYAFCRFTMSHSHQSARLVLLGAQNRSVSRLVFQNAPFPKALFHIDVCSDTSAALETLVMPHISLASWVSQPRPSLPRETQRFPTKRREARRRRTRGGAVLGRIEPAALGCRPLRPLLLLVILGSEGGDGGGATNRRGLWRSGMWRPSKCVAD